MENIDLLVSRERYNYVGSFFIKSAKKSLTFG